MIEPMSIRRHLSLLCVWLALATMFAACDKTCTTRNYQVCVTSGTESLTGPPRLINSFCEIVTTASFLQLRFGPTCGAAGYWSVNVNLPPREGSKIYSLPSPDVAIDAVFAYETEVYTTPALSNGGPPSLRVSGGAINVVNANSSSGEVVVDIQFENSLKEAIALVAHATYSACAPASAVICDD
jgi:hypothetical protein